MPSWPRGGRAGGSRTIQIHVVGFSIGAMVALRAAAARPDLVTKRMLLSPAAPLQLRDFLPWMASRLVFSMAMRHPRGFSALTGFQTAFAQHAPNLMINTMFAGASPSERILLSNATFCAAIQSAFSECLQKHRKA